MAVFFCLVQIEVNQCHGHHYTNILIYITRGALAFTKRYLAAIYPTNMLITTKASYIKFHPQIQGDKQKPSLKNIGLFIQPCKYLHFA